MRRALVALDLLFNRLSGRTVFDGAHYRESELSRLANLFAHADLERWRGMRVLEVGAGPGRIGDAFVHLGFDVTSTDGRPECVEMIRAKGRNAFTLDLDEIESGMIQGYDLIVAFGVLYHLRSPERFIHACGRSSKVLLLETVVCDAPEPSLYVTRERSGWRGFDQALSGRGSRPSPSWVEQICRDAGFDDVRDISSPIANWSIGIFDWQRQGTGEWRRGGMNLRKMWICESPTNGRGEVAGHATDRSKGD